MKKYARFICTISSIVFAIYLTFSIHRVLDLYFTEFTRQEELAEFSSNEKYLKNNQKELKKLTPQKITDLRLAERAERIDSIKRQSIVALIWAATGIIVTLIFFMIHFKLYMFYDNKKD